MGLLQVAAGLGVPFQESMDVLRNTAVDHRGGLAAGTCCWNGNFCLTRAADPKDPAMESRVRPRECRSGSFGVRYAAGSCSARPGGGVQIATRLGAAAAADAILTTRSRFIHAVHATPGIQLGASFGEQVRAVAPFITAAAPPREMDAIERQGQGAMLAL